MDPIKNLMGGDSLKTSEFLLFPLLVYCFAEPAVARELGDVGKASLAVAYIGYVWARVYEKVQTRRVAPQLQVVKKREIEEKAKPPVRTRPNSGFVDTRVAAGLTACVLLVSCASFFSWLDQPVDGTTTVTVGQTNEQGQTTETEVSTEAQAGAEGTVELEDGTEVTVSSPGMPPPETNRDALANAAGDVGGMLLPPPLRGIGGLFIAKMVAAALGRRKED